MSITNTFTFNDKTVR